MRSRTGGAVDVVDDDVDIAVVEEIAEGGAAAESTTAKPGTLPRAERLELLALQVVKEQRPLSVGRAPVRA